MKDYYKILEVSPDDSIEDIKKSYYRLALKFHPDRSDYVRAGHLFTEITEAYSVLSNRQKREEYDNLRLIKFSNRNRVENVFVDPQTNKFEEMKKDSFKEKKRSKKRSIIKIIKQIFAKW